jgi:hypothetical protein
MLNGSAKVKITFFCLNIMVLNLHHRIKFKAVSDLPKTSIKIQHENFI